MGCSWGVGEKGTWGKAVPGVCGVVAAVRGGWVLVCDRLRHIVLLDRNRGTQTVPTQQAKEQHSTSKREVSIL